MILQQKIALSRFTLASSPDVCVFCFILNSAQCYFLLKQSDSLATGQMPASPLPAVRVGVGGGRWSIWVEVARASVLGRGVPLYRRLCLPACPAKNTAGLKPDPPPVWLAQSSRLPDAWLPPHPHALGAPSTPPGQDAEESPGIG